MSHTLLDAVNETLKRVNVLVTGTLLTTLSSSSLQHEIDIAIQVINEGNDELYSGKYLMPNSQAESSITLVTGQREYSLPSDLIRLKWGTFVDKVNTQYLFEFEEGYDAILLLDPQQNYTGLPVWGVISPINGKLRVDRAPDAASNGKTYTFEYQKNVVLANATDTVPFNDEVFRSMVPAWAQLWKRERRNEFDTTLYREGLGRAARMAREEMPRGNYSSRQTPASTYTGAPDPYSK